MSKVQLRVTDETSGGKILNEITIQLKNELVTVKDIIEARVFSEVETYNKKMPEFYRGLVQPSEAEVVLNGFKLRPKKTVDPEKQVYAALDAFQKNGFFILIDDKQAEELDEEVLVSTNTTVTFIKLTQLVGG